MPQEHILEAAPDIGWEMDVAWVDPRRRRPVALDRDATAAASPPSTSRTSRPPGENADEDGWADVGHGTVDWKALMARAQGDAGRSTSSWNTTIRTTSTRFATRSIAAAKQHSEEHATMAKTLGVGIIGCGNISTAYFTLAPLFTGIEVRACADINPDAAKARADGIRRARRDASTTCWPTRRSTSSST